MQGNPVSDGFGDTIMMSKEILMVADAVSNEKVCLVLSFLKQLNRLWRRLPRSYTTVKRLTAGYR